MKRSILFIFLLYLPSYTFCTSQENEVPIYRVAKPKPGGEMPSFHYMTSVSRSDFRNPGETSLLKVFTITQPGNYTFVQDVGHDSTSTTTTIGGQTAIYINSSDVTIDLGGRTLYQNSSTANIDGIETNINLRNITIKNGTIAGFKGHGIIVNYGCDDIKIQNVTVSNCVGPAIYLKGTSTANQDVSNVIIDNCVIAHTTGKTDVDAVGLQIDYGWNILATNSVFSRSISAADDAYGVKVLGTNIVFDNCDTSGNEGGNAYGFYGATQLRSCTFENCSASGHYGSTAGAFGFYVNGGNGNIFTDCKSVGHQGNNNGYGFYLTGSKYNKFEHCYASYCRDTEDTSGNNSAGFYSVGGIGNAWNECESMGNQGANNDGGNVSGFELAGAELQSSLVNCIATANGQTSGSAATAHGFYISSNSASAYCQIKGCKAIGNCSSTANAAYGFRDATATQTKNLFVDNFAFGNTDAESPNNNQNYSVNVSAGVFNESEAGIGGILGLANIPPYYNASVEG